MESTPMSPVRIVGASYVGVPATAELPPEPIKLTAMEALWVVIRMLQHVLLYHDADMPPFDDILHSLKSSLATTLGSFAPLAGRLVHLKDTGDVGISCSRSDGVRFVVAESDADIRRLAGDEEHDVRVLEGLVPAVDMSELPTAVLAVQATRFQGGFAVGLTVHHGVADGRSLWTFVEAWASACRGQIPAATPTFDRSLIKLPGGEELASSILQKIAPNLPSAALASPIGEDIARFTRRTFTLDAHDIQRLKQRIVDLGEAHGTPLPRSPSAFAAIVALAWTCFARCTLLYGPYLGALQSAPIGSQSALITFRGTIKSAPDACVPKCIWGTLNEMPQIHLGAV
ncbi:malonyl-CoA:anthocyanidin 5-O-glucoside-6''-O-malonyltransferase-like [Lolium perenne]|uniref:malonyl-CoA:anthocyanidin 5-O-glucoside-6''-O-malonyltransferase-like n=1 Tax=Lolium perenne TaxID=4522 RepID=UPI0021F5C26B|nr:malonyl-CoA:anthocyanidin 5-O-glucoside-6''-O-malonyltransferase-like [Lolium perenne]